MQERQDIIRIDKNRFPGAVAFVESFDTDEDTESADILSFETLREAFTTLRTVETIAETEFSEKQIPEQPSEQPDYDIDTAIDPDDEHKLFSRDAESPVEVHTRLETIIEAVLFVGNRENQPLCADHIVEKLRNVSVEDIDHTIVRLNEHYQKRNSPYAIISDRGGYRMALRSEFESVRAKFSRKVRQTRLPQHVIDTLAIVAYRQPITAEEVQSLRQQSSVKELNQLVRRNLLEISRKTQDKKSVVRYHTTPRFLELLQIKSLDDMPRVDELDYQ